MYCKNCREKLNENWKYCPKCKKSLNNETIEINEEKIIESKKKEFNEAIIYIIVFFIGVIGMFGFESVNGICFIMSLISIVTAFIKCPNNIFVKILFWLFLICVVLYIIFIIVLIFTCTNIISNCN